MANRITFVHAPEIRYDQNYGTLFVPLWAYTLAAYVPENWDISIIDTIIDDIESAEPSKVFAFSGINQDLTSILEARDTLKGRYPSAKFIVGGPITWSFEQENKLGLLDGFDHIFILDGEESLPQFLRQVSNGDETLPTLIRAERFDLSNARAIHHEIFRKKADQYYGVVVEVSRGCPFLCEFCDIRVLPGNNKSNNKSPNLIVAEMDAHFRLGAQQFQFACDNFIGDIQWARECVDAILAWKKETGAKVSIFTWLTINLYKLPDLMKKMREAGFSIVFIGIESVNQNSLLETAKVQNRGTIEKAVLTIQSYGFIIAPGFIFGFDSDPKTIFYDTLDFMMNVGMIGGDPSFLTALPGTPLYRRMERADRLASVYEDGTVRLKISTNILYLQDSDELISGFLSFLEVYNSPAYQLARFQRHLDCIENSDNFIATDGIGYGSPVEYLSMQLKNSDNRKMLVRRLVFLFNNPSAIVAVLKARWRLWRLSKKRAGIGIHFNYWFYVWTNLVLKYKGLQKSDFQLHSVGPDFDYKTLSSQRLKEQNSVSYKPTNGETKVAHQQRYTQKALDKIIQNRVQS